MPQPVVKVVKTRAVLRPGAPGPLRPAWPDLVFFFLTGARDENAHEWARANPLAAKAARLFPDFAVCRTASQRRPRPPVGAWAQKKTRTGGSLPLRGRGQTLVHSAGAERWHLGSSPRPPKTEASNTFTLPPAALARPNSLKLIAISLCAPRLPAGKKRIIRCSALHAGTSREVDKGSRKNGDKGTSTF